MAEWGSAPTVLIFADSPEGIACASRVASQKGARVAAALPVDEADERLDRQISVDLVIIDVEIDHGPVLDRLFERIEIGSSGGRFAAIVTVAPGLIDIAAAAIEDDAVHLLVGRDEQMLDELVASRISASGLRLHDKSDGDLGHPIRHLLDKIATFGGGLAPAPQDDATADGEPPLVHPFREIDDVSAAEAGVIRDMIRARRLREELFGTGIFADPAWDILLDLTAARIERRSVAVSSLCIAAAVPATTALRWIKQLTDHGLLRRVADPDDGRRIFIELSDEAARTMMTYFANAVRAPRG